MDCNGRHYSEGKEELKVVVEDLDPRGGGSEGVGEIFFKAVTQAVLLFVVETWVLTSRM